MKGQKYKRSNNLDNWKNDVVYTPDWLCKQICEMFDIKGNVLEPCKGEGAFLEFLPKDTEWCEIKEGVDFYEYNKKVDWIVTNPPYSHFEKFLEHSFNIAENIVLLVPVSKIFTSIGKLDMIYKYGGIVELHTLPSSKAGFPFGFPSGVFYFKKGYKGTTNIKMLDGIVYKKEGRKKKKKRISNKLYLRGKTKHLHTMTR